MTDISFLLIIFFLVTAVFMSSQGIALKLPEKNIQPKRLTAEEIILVELYNDGIIRVNGINTESKESLHELIAIRADSLVEPVLILHAYDEVSYDEVVSILDISKSCGVSLFSVQYQDGAPRGLQIEGAEY